MEKYKPIARILQEVISEEELERLVEKHHYKETGRKMTVKVLLQYFMLGAMVESRSFRELSIQGREYKLRKVDYSTLSKKAAEVPYEIYLDLFDVLFNKSNRNNQRKIRSKYGRILKIIDSTRIIAAQSKWIWGSYKNRRSGIKLHVSYLPGSGLPSQIKASPIKVGDSLLLDKFSENDTLLLCDRGYLNIKKMCEFDYAGQEFIIRMREGINQLHQIDFDIAHSPKYQDHLCTLGKDWRIKKEHLSHQFRVINFHNQNGEFVSLCTNVMDLSADQIADIYRIRWQIESFFRALKQNFTIKSIFGRSQNSAFSQAIIAFIAFLFLFTLYSCLSPFSPANCSFLSFLRLLRSHFIPCSSSRFYASLRRLLS